VASNRKAGRESLDGILVCGVSAILARGRGLSAHAGAYRGPPGRWERKDAVGCVGMSVERGSRALRVAEGGVRLSGV